MCQVLEKGYKCNMELYFLYIGFKGTFGTVNRQKLDKDYRKFCMNLEDSSK